MKKIRCIWEHNGNDTLLYASEYVGAFARGDSFNTAAAKMNKEISDYLIWKGSLPLHDELPVEIVQESSTGLDVCDADSDVLFDSEKEPMQMQEYLELKELALKSARDFTRLYKSIPDKDATTIRPRKSFIGQIPRTAKEMYEHTKSVNSYYFGEIGIDADNDGSIYECRIRGFEALEGTDDYLANRVFDGSYGEAWTLRKVIRRFVWHDRIHAKAMYRMAIKLFGNAVIPDVFNFRL